MYNVSIGPSKIVARTRRGISQNLESFQNFSRKPVDFDSGEFINGPKPVFHTISKRFSGNKQQEVISPQHEELIRFVSESWSKIFKEYASDGLVESEALNANNSSTIMYYEDPEPNIFLQNTSDRAVELFIMLGSDVLDNLILAVGCFIIDIKQNP